MRRIEINPDVRISTEKKEHSGIALKALSIATLASLAIISTATPANAEGDNRIIIDTIDKTITGEYSNRTNNNDWHTDDWSSGWYNEWNIEGGIVKNTSQNLTIKDATFDSNTLNVHNPNIVGDDTDPQWMSANGGIIGNTTGSSIKSIDNVIFSNNKTNATYTNQFVKGGVIGNFGTIDSITNTKFTGNTSSAYYGSNFGGAIFNADTGVINKISKSEFIGNHTSSGGAIYNDGTITLIDEVTFKDNIAYTGGGAIFNTDTGRIDKISKSKFIGNGSNSGSAIHNNGTITSIDEVTIKNNNASTGGAIVNNGTITTISNSEIGNNSSPAIYNTGHIGTIDNTNIHDNYGEASILNRGTIDLISNSKITGNSSCGIKSIKADGENDTPHIGRIENTEISNSQYYGINAFASDIDELDGVTIKDNRGNGIYLFGNGESHKIGSIKNSLFENNGQGALYLSHESSLGDVSDSKFISNHNFNGGAIAVYNRGYNGISASVGNFTNVLFENNEGRGGAIYFDSGDSAPLLVGKFKDVTFKNNKSSDSAGALAVIGNVTLDDFENIKFEGNTASNTGGAICLHEGRNTKFGNFTNVSFKNNEAAFGSAISALAGGTFGNWNKVDFIDNKVVYNSYASNGSGGVISLSSATVGNWDTGVMQGADSDYRVYNGGGISAGYSKFGNISKVEFKNLHARNQGGAIWSNESTFGDLTNVSFENVTTGSQGGAIWNNGSGVNNGIFGNLENVHFNNVGIDSSLSTGYSSKQGGAIFNNGTFGSWNNGSVSGLGTEDKYIVTQGGAIWNAGTFGNISNVTFKNLHASNMGGAIWSNSGTFGKLTNVSFENITAGSQGGAIWNNGSGVNNGIFGNLENVHFNKVGLDSSLSTGYFSGQGGAIFNNGTIGDWTNGSAYGLGGADNYIASQGGAIWNNGKFGKITNVLIKDYYAKTGGAIWNIGTMKGLEKVSFINNHATESAGGAIMVHRDSSAFGSVSESLFQDNSAHTWGGAIASHGYLSSIIGSSFINNTAGNGGAIYSSNPNVGTLKDLTFIGNKAVGNNEARLAGAGGAIAVEMSPNFTLEGQNKFINNSAQTRGGAILLSAGTFSDLGESYFEGNTSGSTGGAIHVYGSIEKANNSTFINNKTEGKEPADHSLTYSGGGAIFTSGEIKDISNSTFVGNEVTGMTNDTFNSGNGGAIFSFKDIKNISNSEFNGNKAVNKGGAIWTAQRINKIENSTFANNHAGKNGGALFAENGIGEIVNSSFVGNSANGKGGAIYTTKDLNIVAKDGYTSIFNGNYTEADGAKDQNAIYAETQDGDPFATVTLNAQTNGKFLLNDNIDGVNYNLELTGDKTGEIYINNVIKNANISQNGATTYINDASQLNYNNSLAVNNGTMNISHMGLSPLNLRSFANQGIININTLDINPATETVGRFVTNSYGSHTGTINVNNLNILADPIKEKTNILFADSAFAKSVKYHGTNEYISKIYKYSVGYSPESGEFQFVRGGGSSGAGAFNPAVLSAPVNVQAGANATVNETFKYVFEHADTFTQLPIMDRITHIKANQYALSTDYNENLGNLATEFNNKAGWVRPYVTFEKMNLKNAPAVNATTYGTLVGFDSDFQKLKHGWTGLTTGYIGYNGSQLRYNGGDTTMNGGLLGLTQTFYKGNLWTALTLSAGATVGQTTTMYGKEDFTTLLAGVGSKTGYNFEFKEGKYIIQPIWFMSYTFANTFDYTNAAGVRINADPMHSIMLNPSVRFITNTKNGWQPYASIGMVWNAMNESSVKANNVKLPESSIKPYIEYGVGIQKRFKDRYTAFGQAMIRNGGRNGIAMTFGFRWNLGYEGKPIEKVQNNNTEKTAKVVTTSTEKISNTKTPRLQRVKGFGILCKLQRTPKATTTTTGERKIIKQMTSQQKISKGLLKTNKTSKAADIGVLKYN